MFHIDNFAELFLATKNNPDGDSPGLISLNGTAPDIRRKRDTDPNQNGPRFTWRTLFFTVDIIV